MAENYFNGLDVVSLPPGDHSWLASASNSLDQHPYRSLFHVRASAPAVATRAPESGKPPVTYSQHSLRAPAERPSSEGVVEVHETVRLQDVEAFQMRTCQSARRVAYGSELERVLADLSIVPTSRPVIYRFIDVINNGFALLEAIHFELFKPDRLDLRFIAVPIATVPQTAEGDYFHVTEVDLMSKPSFGVRMIEERVSVVYPVMWVARAPTKMDFQRPTKTVVTNPQNEQNALAYVLTTKQPTRGGELAVSRFYKDPFLLRSTLFVNQEDRQQDSLLRVSVRASSAAHLYPVEPPIAPASYVERVRAVRTSAQRDASRVVSRVSAPSDAEQTWLDDRLRGSFTRYTADDAERMHELFLLGAQMREVDLQSSCGKDAAADAGELRIDESVVLQALRDFTFPLSEGTKRTLDKIYGRRGPVPVLSDPPADALFAGELRLNAEQSRALHYYTMNKATAPRVYCILSPPGSGKTTVAAAMAATVAKNVKEAPKSFLNKSNQSVKEVQLLLSVQNVAVDNMGAALKKMDYGGGTVYNMKSTKTLDPYKPSPFDFFDLAGEDLRKGWRAQKDKLARLEKIKGKEAEKKYEDEKKIYDERLTVNMRDSEVKMLPNVKVILATVEMVLKRITFKIKLAEALEKVTRVIIDEASLLTEAALFCLMRRFPEATFVLIGDDKQLPPFRYDERLFGSRLAGRAGLTVAMNTRRVPVVDLVKVYRAPQSLVNPYNRLAYEDKLESHVIQQEFPLHDLGLVPREKAQLLFVEVNGRQERPKMSTSLYNDMEIEAARSLLNKFPPEKTADVMIICLYKEQKRRLQDKLGNNYTVLTVDSAQGKEKPIVILLTTRTVAPTDGLFFCNRGRCNVAISRQQRALIVLGHAQLLTQTEPWRSVVNGGDFTRIQTKDISAILA